jgi:hypothetical protein
MQLSNLLEEGSSVAEAKAAAGAIEAYQVDWDSLVPGRSAQQVRGDYVVAVAVLVVKLMAAATGWLHGRRTEQVRGVIAAAVAAAAHKHRL